MTPDLTDAAVRRLVVIGHPNHELAIFGFVQRARPHLLFLTDGGGQERVDESRRALASIGALDRAKFLGWREQTLYEALLALDVDTLLQLVDAVRAELVALAPHHVICESVELYNPLHDLTLPIVRAAAAALPEIDIFEFPLIAQEPSDGERYRMQRFAAGRPSIAFHLDARELETKLHLRDHEYHSLRRTTGSIIDVSPDCAGTEVFARAADARGEIDRIVTFADHFRPAAAALAAAAAR
jgi:hypothetical protein